MYKMIRCGSGFEVVILVSPPDADWDTPDAKFYLWQWRLGRLLDDFTEFTEISKETALGYFSGMADGLGFESPPDDIFSTLDDALRYVKEKIRMTT